MNHRHIAGGIFTAVLFAFAPGCLAISGPPVVEMGEECVENANCPNGSSCLGTEVLKVCTPDVPQCTGQIVGECGGYACVPITNVYGQPTTYCATSCDYSVGCDTGFGCTYSGYGTKGECVTGGTACASAADCTDGLTCSAVTLTCVADQCSSNSSCNLGMMCVDTAEGGSSCVPGGTTGDPCESFQDCGNGYDCDYGSYTCVPD